MPITENMQEINRLIQIMQQLRSDRGCPWDRQQTPESLKSYLLEETYELLEAIDQNSAADIRDELGDLLLQIVFICQIYSERQAFDFNDVAGSIADKMVRRHPHVFADASPSNHAARWDEIKHQEREQQGKRHDLASRFPRELPALKASAKLIKKHGPSSADEAWTKILESSTALLSAAQSDTGGENTQTADTLGDLLYAVAQLAGTLRLDPEDILRQTNNRKIEHFDKKNMTDLDGN